MFQTISIVGFLIAVVGIALHYIASPRKGHVEPPLGILKRFVRLLTPLFLEQRLSLLGKLKNLVYLLTLLSFVVLVVTGFYPVLVLGEHLCGYLLMVHTSAGGVFSACLAFLAISWAQQNRFNQSDWPWLRRLIRKEAAKEKFFPQNSDLARKACFWAILMLTLPVILSVILSMFPLFGTAGQYLLLNTHRYSTLLLAMVAIVHTYLVILTRRNQ